jgi:hypothetical protein
VNHLWWELFWRVASRITGAGFVLGWLYAPIFYTLIFIPNLLFNHSAYENVVAILGFYVVTVLVGAVFGCIFGTILGAVLGVIQGVVTLVIARYFFYPPHDEIQLKYSLTASSLIVSLVVGYVYLAKVLPGMSSLMFIVLHIITVIANVWMVRKIGDWYLSKADFSLSDEFQPTDAGDEP